MKRKLLLPVFLLIALQGWSQNYLVQSGDTLVVLPIQNVRNINVMLFRYKGLQQQYSLQEEVSKLRLQRIKRDSVIISKLEESLVLAVDSIGSAYEKIEESYEQELTQVKKERNVWIIASGGSAVLAFVSPPLALVPPAVVVVSKKLKQKKKNE